MAQTTLGSVSVTNGSNLVTASADADWTAFQNGVRVFWVQNTNASYLIAAVRAPNVNVSGRWELNLVANYAGSTVAGTAYVVTNSFSAQLQLPLLAYGDVQGNVVFTRAMLLIEGIILGLQNSNPSRLGTAANATVRVDANGNIQIKNVTTGTWKFLAAMGAEGAETLVLLTALP